MTRPLALLVAAVAVYDIVAYKTGLAPTITHGVHQVYRHFQPHCDGCTCVRPLVPQAANRHPAWPARKPR